MSNNKPLPEELRPNSLDFFIGQSHLRAKLTTLLQTRKLPSLLLYGPPGCGKSTLALLLAQAHSKNVKRLSAPEVGLQQLRKVLADTEILVIDELHRFSKAQQDFFLPLVESGELVLVGTTTEAPSYSITPQLLSRVHVLRLQKLLASDLSTLAQRGALKLGISLEPEVIEILSILSGGDARTLLNLVEYVSAIPEEQRTHKQIKELLPEIIARHDKQGDNHYERISALIKSVRGSDPDAAIYYLACLLEGGEDPRFICRRLIILAAEDIGLADPQALTLASACLQAVENIGMPEGALPMAELTLYLALAKKSNTAYAAYMNAQKEIKLSGIEPVPFHLRNPSNSLQREWGYGKGYLYPHNYPNAWVEQEYLPEKLQNRQFYFAKNTGTEHTLSSWIKQLKSKK